MRELGLLLTLIATGVVLIAGCGGDDDDDDASATPVPGGTIAFKR